MKAVTEAINYVKDTINETEFYVKAELRKENIPNPSNLKEGLALALKTPLPLKCGQIALYTFFTSCYVNRMANHNSFTPSNIFSSTTRDDVIKSLTFYAVREMTKRYIITKYASLTNDSTRRKAGVIFNNYILIPGLTALTISQIGLQESKIPSLVRSILPEEIRKSRLLENYLEGLWAGFTPLIADKIFTTLLNLEENLLVIHKRINSLADRFFNKEKEITQI